MSLIYGPAWLLKRLEQQPLPRMWLVPSVVLGRVQGKVECFLSPRSGQPDMPSERAAHKVGHTIRKPCDVRPEDADLSLELGH